MSTAADDLVPTLHLRFVDRDPSGNYSVHQPNRVLQQWWERFGQRDIPHDGEWRDVPAIAEPEVRACR